MLKSKLWVPIIIGILVVSVALAFDNTPASAANPAPIKIGILAPQTGAFAEAGQDIIESFKIALDDVNYKVAGRQIQLIIEDTEGKPATGVSKAKKLVELDKVDFLVGPYSSAVALAVRNYVHEQKVPLVIPGGGTAMALSYAAKSPWVWRCSAAAGQFLIGFPTFLAKDLGYKKMILLVQDTPAGRDNVTMYTKEFSLAGGKVIQVITTPVGTMDYAPYFPQFDKTADVVAAEIVGSDSFRFVQQYKEYNVWSKYPLVGAAIIIDETLHISGDAAIGIKGSMNYCFNLTTPINNNFAKKYKAKLGRHPGHLSPASYEAGQAVIFAINQVKGKISNNTTDRQNFLTALSQAKFVGPRGPFSFEQETQTAVNTVYFREVIKKDGEFTFKIFKTIPNVKVSDVQKLLSQ
jgi:branched-chain amino acid transport system substrate-binding protein